MKFLSNILYGSPNHNIIARLPLMLLMCQVLVVVLFFSNQVTLSRFKEKLAKLENIRFSAKNHTSSNPDSHNNSAHLQGKCDIRQLNEARFNGKFVDQSEKRLMKLFSTASSSSQESINVVDVGANIGLFTSLACETFPKAVLHSFEPGDSSRAWLKSKVSHVCGGRVRLYSEAISDVDGMKVSLYGPKKQRIYTDATIKPHNTGASISSAVNSRRGSTTLLGTTTTARLDSILRNLTSLDLVKIDAEGYDALVLHGLEGMLGKKVQTLYWEYSTAWGLATTHTYTAVVRWLKEFGYDSYVIGIDDAMLVSNHNCLDQAFLDNVTIVHNVLSIHQTSKFGEVPFQYAGKRS